VRHGLPFDPTHGYDLDALLAVTAPDNSPADFDDFWTARYRLAREVDVAVHIGQAVYTTRTLRTHTIEYTSVGGLRIGGWLTVPADGHVTRGVVASHGYSGRGQPDPALHLPGAATIWPCSRGLPSRSRHRQIPDAATGHVLHGIDAADTYVHGDCAADIWCAATALTQIAPSARSDLAYLGDSFGGGVGALALAYDHRFRRASLAVPSFGHHPLRLTMPCTGSGRAVRQRYRNHPEVIDVLRYFDAATAATRIQIPVHVGAALFDPAVPPPGQFAVHNALAGRKELFVLTAGHFDHPDANAEYASLRRARLAFLRQPIADDHHGASRS
jgi:cephalosporin-C deacetylase